VKRIGHSKGEAASWRAELAEVEQQDAALEHEVYLAAGIAERRVDEMRIETARHGDLHLKSALPKDA
jgi:hypothetical protein